MFRNRSLGLFFTLGMSLRSWERGGMLDREIVLYNELAKHFRRIYFFTYGGGSELRYKSKLASNIRIIPAPAMPSLLYSLLLPLIHYHHLRKCDILKTNQMRGAWTALLTKFIYGGRLVVRNGYSWSMNVREQGASAVTLAIIRLVERLCYVFADKIIMSFDEGVSYVRQQYGMPQGKIVCLPNWIDTTLFTPRHVLKKAKAILFIGRLAREKNLPALIDAIAGSGITLDIIGDGLLRAKLEHHARRRGVRVCFLGVIPNHSLPEFINQYPVFVLPSKYECMPKTLLEAMSCGCAVVGTNVRGIREVIDDGVNGLLCTTDSKSIRRAILSLMSNRRMRMRLGRAARKKVSASYALKVLAERELTIYQHMYFES